MAKEETEKTEAAPAPAKAANAWLPTIAVLVLMPVISFGMTQFVLIPRIKAAVTQQGVKAETGGGEKGEKGHEKKPDGKPGFSYDFNNIVVNLSGAGGTRYLKASFTAFSSKPDLQKILTENKNQLLDVALGVLSSKSMTDLESPGSKNMVRNDLVESFNQALKSDIVEQLYFSEFVVQ